MFNVTIICFGNIKEKYYRDALAEYEKRLSGYCRLNIIELRDGADALPLLPKRACRIALCVEGRQLSSGELADYIEKRSLSYSDFCFVIGGFDGLDERVKQACDMRLSFSKMTFPHRLMRVILLEQLYRAFDIIAGGNYHK